jgi:peroxidase
LIIIHGVCKSQAGGPFYPLYTGRRDGTLSFRDVATHQLPSPDADLSETLASFASWGFDERETVSLLGTNLSSIVWLLLSLAILLKKYK